MAGRSSGSRMHIIIHSSHEAGLEPSISIPIQGTTYNARRAGGQRRERERERAQPSLQVRGEASGLVPSGTQPVLFWLVEDGQQIDWTDSIGLRGTSFLKDVRLIACQGADSGTFVSLYPSSLALTDSELSCPQKGTEPLHRPRDPWTSSSFPSSSKKPLLLEEGGVVDVPLPGVPLGGQAVLKARLALQQ